MMYVRVATIDWDSQEIINRNRSGGKKSSDIYPTGVGSAGSKDGAD
jgi:hypothetical protein